MKNSNKLLMALLCLSMVWSVGCQKIGLGGDSGNGGGSGSASGGDPLVGQTYYRVFTSTNGDIELLEAKLIDNQNIKYIWSIYPGGNLLTAYTNVKIGTYTRVGNVYSLTFTHETCDAQGSGQVTITYSDPGDSINFQTTGGNTVTNLLNSARHPMPIDKTQTVNTTEDVGCTHF